MPITCDEGVYHIAREIMLDYPEEFKNLVLCMGSFHMMKNVLACFGKYLNGSGARQIWTETGIYGVNVVESIIAGTNYIRSLKGMLLPSESMERLRKGLKKIMWKTTKIFFKLYRISRLVLNRGIVKDPKGW